MSTASFNAFGPASAAHPGGHSAARRGIQEPGGLVAPGERLPDDWSAACYAAGDAGRMQAVEVMTTHFFPDSERKV